MTDLDTLLRAFDEIGVRYSKTHEPPDTWEGELPKSTRTRIRQGTNFFAFTASDEYLGYSWMGSDESDNFDKPKQRKGWRK